MQRWQAGASDLGTQSRVGWPKSSRPLESIYGPHVADPLFSQRSLTRTRCHVCHTRMRAAQALMWLYYNTILPLRQHFSEKKISWRVRWAGKGPVACRSLAKAVRDVLLSGGARRIRHLPLLRIAPLRGKARPGLTRRGHSRLKACRRPPQV